MKNILYEIQNTYQGHESEGCWHRKYKEKWNTNIGEPFFKCLKWGHGSPAHVHLFPRKTTHETRACLFSYPSALTCTLQLLYIHDSHCICDNVVEQQNIYLTFKGNQKETTDRQPLPHCPRLTNALTKSINSCFWHFYTSIMYIFHECRFNKTCYISIYDRKSSKRGTLSWLNKKIGHFWFDS